MKLVDLLARELGSWPEGEKYITQDYDGEIWPCNDPNEDLEYNGSRWTSTQGFTIGRDIIPGCELASDHSTAIITRAQWQSARDKLKGETKVPKANKDGWIRHRGGKCPVAEGVLVDVRHRDGEVVIGVPAGVWIADRSNASEWVHNNDKGDIMAYRIHAPEQAIQQEAIVQFNEQTAKAPISVGDEQMPAAKPIDGPIKWRDRIREIDSTVDALEEERESLIQRLAEEGFKLLRVDGKAMPKQPELDMGDWRNWLPGDQVEVTGSDNGGWLTKKGRIGTVFRDECGDMRIEYQGGDYWYIHDNCTFKWHSRPSK